MTQLPNCVRTNIALQESIASSIVAAVDGMYAQFLTLRISTLLLTFCVRFLLAQLDLDSLKDQTSAKAIKRALMELPKGFKGLDKAYKGAMQRIDDQLEGFRFLAKQVLGWLTYAKRLMSVEELQYAIAIELGERRFDANNLADPSELVSVCAGLAVVDDQPNVVKLVHYTTQEYFVQHGESLLPGARKTIAESCLTCLVYDDFATGRLHKRVNERDDISPVAHDDDKANTSSSFLSRTPKSVKALLNKYPFYEYAVKYWAKHADHGVEYSAESRFLDFVKDDERISSVTQALIVLNWDGSMLAQFDRDESRSSKPVSAMHLLAYLGADRLISILLDQGFEADTKDLNNATPLWWAAYNDDVEMVKLLIARKDVDVNACNDEGRTPLSRAAEMGNSAVVELLLTRKDIRADAKDLEHETPLFYAVFYGYEEIVRQLLKRDDVDINTVNKNGYTPLHRATILKDEGIAAILLARADINVDPIDKNGQTPLIRAARLGYTATVELLLSHDGLNANADCFVQSGYPRI